MKYIKLFEEFNNNLESALKDFYHQYMGHSLLHFKKLEYLQNFLKHNGLEYKPSDYLTFSFLGQEFAAPIMFMKDVNTWKEWIQKIKKGEEILLGYDKDIKNQLVDWDSVFWKEPYTMGWDIGDAVINNEPISYQQRINDITKYFKNPIKVLRYLISVGVVRTKEKKEATKKYNSVKIKGIIIQDIDDVNLETIDTLFKKLEEVNVYLNSQYLRAIRFRKIPRDKYLTEAQFLPQIRTMILNSERFDPEFDFELFLHEYTHAVDKGVDLTEHFIEYYKEFIKKIYEKTNDDRLSDTDRWTHELSTKEYYGGIYDEIIDELGFKGLKTYSIKNVKEFTCDLMAHYLIYKKVHSNMVEKCKEIESKYYN